MLVVVFGLTISSSWGNGHATLWRALAGALRRAGCRVAFFERDQPYYSAHRDLIDHRLVDLHLYESWSDIEAQARRSVRAADVVVVTSYSSDGARAVALPGRSGQTRVLYDMDTPVTLSMLADGQRPPWLGVDGLAAFDLVLSYTGGAALTALAHHGGKRVQPLYGFADPAPLAHTAPVARYACDLSYLGTYAADRQQALEELFIAPASCLPSRQFVIGGALYPREFPWQSNIRFVRHLPPSEHPAFFASSRLTLNVTRSIMKSYGWCPPGRLFEAAAFGAPILSDWFDGLDAFFEPDREIIIVRDRGDVEAALGRSDAELSAMARAAHERTSAKHTADVRVRQLLAAITDCQRATGPVLAAATGSRLPQVAGY